ncbi:hypothetical protein O3P69_002101 [Scylla paramamosain]|uniref:Uncharacterized protein n=1 Tax=Scylla paramamosain TaxID=85552 RepID=A0AAW0V764_SCYPA
MAFRVKVAALLLTVLPSLTDASTGEAVALITAAREGRVKEVRALLDDGIPIDSTDDAGQTALQAGARSGSLGVVQELISHQANMSVSDKWGKTALHEAASFGREDIVSLLLEHDANVAAVDATGKVALHEAAWLGRKGVVEALLAHNANVLATDNNGQTPLHYASEQRQTAVVRTLLDHGALVNAKDKGGLSPLHYASLFGQVEVAETLLEHDADPAARTDLGCHRQQAVAAILLQQEAPLDAVDGNGNTALHLAVRDKNTKIAEMLLLRCPDLTLRNLNRKKAVDVAREEGMDQLAALIQAQSRVPCQTEGATCQKGEVLGVAPLQRLTCRDTWKPTPLPEAGYSCRVGSQVLNHGSSWHDGCHSYRCVLGQVWRNPEVSGTCCVTDEGEYGDGATWTDECQYLECRAGKVEKLAIAGSCCRDGDNVYGEGEEWSSGCHQWVCRSGKPQVNGTLPICCEVMGEMYRNGARWPMGCFYAWCNDGFIETYAMMRVCKMLFMMVVLAVGGVVTSVVLTIALLRVRKIPPRPHTKERLVEANSTTAPTPQPS